MTHERNVLMWAVSRPTRMAVLAVVIMLLVAWFSTGCASPTEADELNPKQEMVKSYVECFAASLGWAYTVHTGFSDNTRKLPKSDCGLPENDPRECAAAGWGANGSVTVYNWWLDDPAVDQSAIRDIAAHEVCHAVGLLFDHGPQWQRCYERLLAGEECP